MNLFEAIDGILDGPPKARPTNKDIARAFAEAGVVIRRDTGNSIYVSDEGECCVKLEGDVTASQLSKLVATGLAPDFTVTWSNTELWIEWQA